MVEIKEVCKKYDELQVLDHLNLTIRRGELFGFVGPNGAGKTTTIRILVGLLQADSGEVNITGVTSRQNNDLFKKKIGYMPDFFGVYDNLKVMEYMEFYASIYGIGGEEAQKRCYELLEMVDLADKREMFVDDLSRGMKQRLCLARCLIHDPELLVLDEPTSGLDPKARYDMKQILMNLRKQGKTILISSHILSELSEICTTIGIIDRGKMLIKGTVDEIMEQMNLNNPLIVKVQEGRDTAVRILKSSDAVNRLSIEETTITVGFTGDAQEQARLLSEMIRQGVEVVSYTRQSGDLEEVFLKLLHQ